MMRLLATAHTIHFSFSSLAALTHEVTRDAFFTHLLQQQKQQQHTLKLPKKLISEPTTNFLPPHITNTMNTQSQLL